MRRSFIAIAILIVHLPHLESTANKLLIVVVIVRNPEPYT